MTGQLTTAELEAFVQVNGYLCARQLDDGRVIAVTRTLINWRLLIGGTDFVDHGFCYHTLEGVMEGFGWDPPLRGLPDPPGGWHKSATDGRVR